jgi:predicted ATPase
MITRIKIDGFKSLVNVDVQLGPFTCIAGSNAVGKSNFFDALIFLSNLADKTLVEAAKSVRSDGKTYGSIRDIFHKSGGIFTDKISFEVSLLIPNKAEDELGQQAVASITSVQYSLVLRYNDNDDEEPIIIEKEELEPITLREARKNIEFHASNTWKDAVIHGKKTTPFISTKDDIIRIHQDKRGGVAAYRPPKMQRTLLSNTTAEYPTAFMVRHEMRSWRMLQLEPSALRQPDDFDIRRSAQLASNGAHLPATLYRLYNEYQSQGRDIYQEVTNKLSSIIDDLGYVSVEKDEKRELLTLQVQYSSGAAFPANTLSDGTLRFLGLSVLELDNLSDGVICFEEPENGIHPIKIPAIIDLLQNIAVDTEYGIDSNNPFRQVIINTHSPLVVKIVPEDSLLMAEFEEAYNEHSNSKYFRTVFKGLSNTWRDSDKKYSTVTTGTLLNYLNPVDHPIEELKFQQGSRRVRRVIDRPEIQPELPFLAK